MFFNTFIRSVVFLFLLCEAAQGSEALDKLRFSLGGDIGYSKQTTSVATELDKQGLHSSLKLIFSRDFKHFVIDFGPGYSLNYMEGSSSSGLVLEEDITTHAFLAETSIRGKISQHWELGLSNQLLIGDDVGLNATGAKKNLSWFLGPQIAYRSSLWNREFRALLTGLTDLNISDRQNYLVLVGFQLGLHSWSLGSKDSQVSTPSKTLTNTKKKEQIAERRREKEGEKRFNLESKKSVFFEFGSAKLTEDTKVLLQRIASSLAKNEKEWELLVIEGHSDSTGEPDFNLALSDQRARAVADFLEEQQVPRSKLRVEAFGEAEPLLENSNAPENRRVEFVFKGVKNAGLIERLMGPLEDR